MSTLQRLQPRSCFTRTGNLFVSMECSAVEASHCSSQTKKKFSYSFTQSLLSLVLIVGLFGKMLDFNDGLGRLTQRGVEGDPGKEASLNKQQSTLGNQFNAQWTGTYNWQTTYDGLGRLIQTTSQGNTINYYYDPEVEFLELGHNVNGSRTWNLYGPDRSGTYGGAQGIGGLESSCNQDAGTTKQWVNNYFGDAVGWHDFSSYQSFSAPLLTLGAYGPILGSPVPKNSDPQWRGHYIDDTGLYYMGTRYYDPVNGRFISPDPLGHGSSLGLYDYCNGDPVNGLDPDGRCVESTLNAIPGQAAWQQSVASFNNGDYGQATFSFGLMLSEQALTVATLGMGSVATTGMSVTSAAVTETAAIEDTVFTNWNEFQVGTRGQFASRAEAGVAWKNYKQGMSVEIEAAKKSLNYSLVPQYPPTPELPGTYEHIVLQPGDIIDRYGLLGGKWFSRPGIPYGARSIPPGKGPYSMYQVLKPFEVNQSLASPGFLEGQVGFGPQIESPVSANVLIKRGIIKPYRPYEF